MHLPNMLWTGLKRAGHVVVMIGANSSGGAVRTPYDGEEPYRPRPSEHRP